jgi:hypothetical protein
MSQAYTASGIPPTAWEVQLCSLNTLISSEGYITSVIVYTKMFLGPWAENMITKLPLRCLKHFYWLPLEIRKNILSTFNSQHQDLECLISILISSEKSKICTGRGSLAFHLTCQCPCMHILKFKNNYHKQGHY